MKKIYLVEFLDLKGHVHINESELEKKSYVTQLEKKYKTTNIRFIYSSDAYESLFRSATRTAFLKKYESGFGDYLFKVSVKEALLIIINSFVKNFEVDKEYEPLVLDRITKQGESQKQSDTLYSNQKQFIDRHLEQYQKINGLWEKFWDSKYHEFEIQVRNSNPENEGYRTKFIDLIENWRKEASSLPYRLKFQCPLCDSDTDVNLVLLGPGYENGYNGGPNDNTYTYSEIRDIYGPYDPHKPWISKWAKKKLKPNHKYHWRSIYSMNGDCPNCKANIFATNQMGQNITPNSFTNCSIYPFHDRDTWRAWCGVWFTYYRWLSVPHRSRRDGLYEFAISHSYETDDTPQFLFEAYNGVAREFWR